MPAQERECPAILQQQVLNISNLTDIQSESCDITRAEQINLDRSRDTPVPILSTQTDNFNYTALAVEQNGALYDH